MIQFPEEYFKGEYIGDFYVEEMMKRAWAAQIRVVEEIDKVCKKYDIKWYMDSGTLLGAVRHKGFIPWDDDLDIAMKRQDYKRFLEVAQKELPNGYVVLDVHSEPEWNLSFARVCNGNTIDIGKERMEQYYGCPYAVGVDIFPLDHLPVNADEEDVLVSIINILANLAATDTVVDDAFYTNLSQIENILKMKADRNGNVKHEVLKMLDNVSQLYNDDEKGDLTMIYYYMSHKNYRFSSKCYNSTIMLPFEATSFPAPVGYDEVLTAVYGNYMVPVRGMQDHDYPFYRVQEQQLKKMMQQKGLS